MSAVENVLDSGTPPFKILDLPLLACLHLHGDGNVRIVVSEGRRVGVHHREDGLEVLFLGVSNCDIERSLLDIGVLSLQ